MRFFGADLNGDGVLGTFTRVPERRGVGLPIFTTRRPNASSQENLVMARSWTGNGQPSSIVSSEGQTLLFEYYLPGALGSASPPTRQTASSGSEGMFASVRSARYDDTYPITQGPQTGSCTALAGSYQWLLPSTCLNVDAELTALGLPREAVQAVLESKNTTASARFETTSFSYNVTGRPRLELRETGSISRLFDTDGRLRDTTDLLGTVTKNQFNARAQRIATTRTDASGTLVDAIYLRPTTRD